MGHAYSKMCLGLKIIAYPKKYESSSFSFKILSQQKYRDGKKNLNPKNRIKPDRKNSTKL